VVVLAGQYRGEDARQRVYGEVEVTVYASDASDWLTPTVVGVSQVVDGTSATVVVTATDSVSVCRVVVAYTDGESEWKSVDLTASGGDTWQGELEVMEKVEYLVQVVDGAGNVTVDDNDGSYYTVVSSGHRVYLPVVLREGGTQSRSSRGTGGSTERWDVIDRERLYRRIGLLNLFRPPASTSTG
jgi:hypothetical protein